MRYTPFGLIHLPTTFAVVAAFFPPVAAMWARRSLLREPAGQVAVYWLVMALNGAVGMVLFLTHHQALAPFLAFVSAGLTPVLLLPPTLQWIGRDARKLLWPLVAGWGLVWGIGAVGAGGPRQFETFVDPFLSGALCAVSAWALAACVRRAPLSLARADWFWILVGHILYFTTKMVRMPLIESLVAHHWAATLDAHNGIMVLYIATYILIARGMLVRATVSAPPSALTPAMTPAA